MVRVVLSAAVLAFAAPAFAQTVTPAPVAVPPVASAPQTSTPATPGAPAMTPAATASKGSHGCGAWRTAELPTS